MEAATGKLTQQATALLKQGDKPAAMTLLSDAFAAGQDDPRALTLLMRLQIADRRSKDLLQTLRMARRNKILTWEVRRSLLVNLTRCNLDDQHAILKILFGAVPETVESGLAMFSHTMVPPQIARPLMRALEVETGKPVPDRKTWMARLDEGCKRSVLNRILSRLNGSFAEDDEDGLASATDLAPVTNLLEAGRNVILMKLHGIAGDPMAPLGDWLSEHKVPITKIGNGMRPASALPHFNLNARAPDLPIQFAKLCKLMKTGPRLVQIYPDGAQGGSFATVTVGGIDLQVGLGGAKLAYFGKAALVFARSRWTETGVEIDYWPGPEAKAGMTSEEVDALFAGFYRDCLVRVMADDPVHLGMIGGYWRKPWTHSAKRGLD